MNLIAFDAPIASFTRLINSLNKVTSFRRLKNDDVRTCISRFQCLAAEHLMHVSENSSFQIDEVLAITLLNIANLEEGKVDER